MKYLEPYRKAGRTIAVYHGLGGSPTQEKINALRKAGFKNIIFNHIDYDYEWKLDRCRSLFTREVGNARRADVILGTSLGGYLAFLLAKLTGKDLIMINPSLDRNRTQLNIRHFDVNIIGNHFGKVEIFFGEKDELIPRNVQKGFLYDNRIKYTSWIVKGMEHRTSPREFEQIVQYSKIINGD